MNKRKMIYKTIMLIVLTALITFIITAVYLTNVGSLNILGTERKYTVLTGENSKLELYLKRIRNIIDEKFIGEINEDKLLDGAIKGYVDGLGDDYTEYFTAEEMEEFMTETEGSYLGIGIYMTLNTNTNAITILSTVKNSPAEEAGLLSGDIIRKIDDVEYTGEDFEKVASIIKGKEGTYVKLEIEREGELKEFNIERRKVELYPIETEILESNIGYMSIESFADGTAKEFKQKYEKLKKQKIKSLIIDLRNNGGGIVDEALKIADYITEKDSILLISLNKSENETIEKAKEKPIVDVPVVILVNNNTASAAELLAVAVQENDKGKLVGETTYGKGVIQELMTLNTGAGLKITTEEYYTPKRNKINKTGIKPDYEVKLPQSVQSVYLLERKDDTQLQKAIELLK